MNFPFSREAHAEELGPKQLFSLCEKPDTRTSLVRRVFFRATPRVFPTAVAYGDFLDRVALILRIHPHDVHVRGSGLLGFSTTPSAAKLWKPIDTTHPTNRSDIDVAVADSNIYRRWIEGVDEWEKEHPLKPNDSGPEWKKAQDRNRQRSALSLWSESLPDGVGTLERRAMAALDTHSLCGHKRAANILVFRDWAALEKRCLSDLAEIWTSRGRLPDPP